MKRVRIRRRWKVLAAGLLALTCIGVLFNIWFIQNTNAIIESLVSARSDGRIQLQLERSSFQYFKKKIVLRGATFYSADTSDAKTTYQFKVPKLDFKIRSFWAFVLRRELLLDSIALKEPEVTVTRISKAKKQDQSSLSVPEEIGRIYNSILDALEVLQVKRFQVEGGKFNLINKIDPDQPVTTISNIHFYLNNFYINSENRHTEKFLNSDNAVLRVTNQDFTLPDGIHKISFKNLLINAGRRQVQLDSCWVKAETKNDRNAFRIFFDVLKMTNLDFAALYKRSEIKADSVYVDNPDIELALEIKQKEQRGKRLELDTIIQKFTGDLTLGYIGVQNAAVNIVANRGASSTSFRSNNDNFKMYGLRINSDSVQPVYVDEFAMILRKYETYGRDSSMVYRFDSLRFTNKRVRLSNFTIQSVGASRGKGTLYYSIPAFELAGLSWEDLLFDRYITADKAVLFNPVIQYSVGTTKRKQNRSSLFEIISGLNQTIDLNDIEVKNGTLNLQFAPDKRLELQHVDLALASKKLLASTTYTGMQQAINHLALGNAVFTTGNLRAELTDLQYSDKLHADALHVTKADQSFMATANGITLNDLVWNNQEKSVFVDQLGWQQANLVIRTSPKRNTLKPINALIRLSSVHGKNTLLTIYATNSTIRTQLDDVKLHEVLKKGTDALKLDGLAADGRFMEIAAGLSIKSGTYHFVDNGVSNIRQLSVVKQTALDTFAISIPQTVFKTGLQDLLNGKLHFDKITASAPLLRVISSGLSATPATNIKTPLPDVSITELNLLQPAVYYRQQGPTGATLEWLQTGDSINHWTVYNILTAPGKKQVKADRAALWGTDFIFSSNGKRFGVADGRMQLTLKDILVDMRGTLQWQVWLQRALFQNPIPLIAKDGDTLRIAGAEVEHMKFASGSGKNVYQLLKENPDAQLALRQGSYTTATSMLQWKNLGYNQSNRSIALDSLQYQPTLSRDSAIAQAPGQIDYLHGVLKKLNIQHFDMDAWEKQQVIAARRVELESPEINVYRDKRKPYIAGKLRALPLQALQSLPLQLEIDTISMKNGSLTYTEMSNKTAQEGSITVTRINSQLFPVRNIHVGASDSLEWRADGYLMDSARLRLRLKAAYNDSLGTFALALRLSPGSLTYLNPALIPIASVKLISGNIDSATMRAIGNDYFSIGAMQLYYNNLKVQFLAKGSQSKKNFLSSLITFAANNFVIRKTNNHRTGTVYFLRDRNRGFFHFLIKTALSGVASSIGAKRNKTYIRQYKRQQKLYKLPLVDMS